MPNRKTITFFTIFIAALLILVSYISLVSASECIPCSNNPNMVQVAYWESGDKGDSINWPSTWDGKTAYMFSVNYAEGCNEAIQTSYLKGIQQNGFFEYRNCEMNFAERSAYVDSSSMGCKVELCVSANEYSPVAGDWVCPNSNPQSSICSIDSGEFYGPFINNVTFMKIPQTEFPNSNLFGAPNGYYVDLNGGATTVKFGNPGTFNYLVNIPSQTDLIIVMTEKDEVQKPESVKFGYGNPVDSNNDGKADSIAGQATFLSYKKVANAPWDNDGDNSKDGYVLFYDLDNNPAYHGPASDFYLVVNDNQDFDFDSAQLKGSFECSSNSDCNDNNPLTYDECINPSTSISECRNTPINCASNLDCGTSGYIGQEYCSSNNVYKNFANYSCINPGTTLSYCSNNVLSQLIQLCSNGCSNGQCLPSSAICGNGIKEGSEQCDDGNTNNNDACSNSCILNTITCYTNSDCGNTTTSQPFCSSGNSVYNSTSYSCINGGTTSSSCVPSTTTLTNQMCQYGCFAGICLNNTNNFAVSIISPTDGQNVQNPVNLSYIILGNADSCYYNLNSGNNISIPNCQNITINLGLGNQTINLFARNSTLNQTVSDSVSFFVTSNQSNQTNATSIVLNSPSNGAKFYTESGKKKEVTFRFTPTDADGFQSCTLFYSSDEKSGNSIFTNPSSGIQYIFQEDLPISDYTWKVSCTDNKNNSASSQTYSFYVKKDTSNPSSGGSYYSSNGSFSSKFYSPTGLNYTLNNSELQKIYFTPENKSQITSFLLIFSLLILILLVIILIVLSARYS